MADKVFITKFWKVITYDPDGDYDGVKSNLSFESIRQRLLGLRCYYAVIRHDSDVMEDGSPKKPHYHWVVEFKTNRSLDYVRELFGVNVAFPCRPDINLDYRYLLHLDSPNKFQYALSNIITNFLDEQLNMRLVSAEIDGELNYLHLLSYAEMVARGELKYRDLYRAFPYMVHKAAIVSALVSQLQDDFKPKKEDFNY